ncbi:MAG: hypothetical protein EB128_04060 [Betaproteobacteria bacterium]|nr:hypothetical protein [Betaproteobacteria bacterium]
MKGNLGIKAGKVPWAVAVTSTVKPLGAALAAAPVPMEPLAPALLSVTTDTFHLSANFGPSKRASRSAPVPVVKGTNKVTGPEGYALLAFCALTWGLHNALQTANTAQHKVPRRVRAEAWVIRSDMLIFFRCI